MISEVDDLPEIEDMLENSMEEQFRQSVKGLGMHRSSTVMFKPDADNGLSYTKMKFLID